SKLPTGRCGHGGARRAPGNLPGGLFAFRRGSGERARPLPMKRPKLTIVPNPGVIAIRGARQNNLKGIDLDVPLGQLNVISGPSGSGKSSLAFDTIYAEGQRRYVETFSPYTR